MPQAAATSFMETIRFSFNLCNVSLLNRFLIHIKQQSTGFVNMILLFSVVSSFLYVLSLLFYAFLLYVVSFCEKYTGFRRTIPCLTFDFFRFFLKRFLSYFSPL